MSNDTYYSGEIPPRLPSPRDKGVYLVPVSSPPPVSPSHTHAVSKESTIVKRYSSKEDQPRKLIPQKKSSLNSTSPPALPARGYPRSSSLETPSLFPSRPPPALPTSPRPSPALPTSSYPPPLSKKPPPPAPPTQTSDSDEDDAYVDLERSAINCPINPEVDGLSFLSFVDRNKDKLPIAFGVTMGYSGRGEEASISEGERFVAHFQRRTRIFTIETENRDTYSIPLNTSFEFAVLYNPNNNKKEALHGFFFKTAGELMLLRTLPKVVRAKKHFRGISPESSVEANELLFIMEVVQKNVERAYVKCISGNSGKEKQLHKECAGEFTTSPHDIKTYLPEILQHFNTPLTVMMCLGIDNTEDITSSLISAVVTITKSHIIESIVASSITDEHENNGEYITPDDPSSVYLNDIPITFDINVHTIPVSPLNMEKLIGNTKSLFDNFNPVGVYPYLTTYATGQHALMKSLRKDEGNKIGIELIEPPSVQKLRAKQSEPNSMSGDGLSKYSKQLELLQIRQNNLETKMRGILQARSVPTHQGADTKAITTLQRENQQLKNDVIRLNEAIIELHDKINSKLCMFGH